LAIDNPLNDPKGKITNILWYFDIVFTVIFIFEAVIKIITYGFLFNGEESYLRNYWNFIDFCIVITSILSASSTIDLSILKVFRMARILRPLRLISKNKGLQLSIEALIMAIPSILNVLLITVLFFLIFMIIGVNFLKGLYY
jgi:hypothetical protein